jgi:hypothetical protein
MSNKGKVSYTTVDKVIAGHFFTRGIKDFVAGKGFDKDYEKWAYIKGVNAQLDYERGRQFAAATGGNIPTKTGPGNKRVSWRAVSAFASLVQEKAII